ncbi:hypothetical protein [Pantanalinema sp. GBBB05]
MTPTQRAQAIIDQFRPKWQGDELQWIALRSAIAQAISLAVQEATKK